MPDGLAQCHGCESYMMIWTLRWEHAPDCPGLCVRQNCPWHPKDR